MAEVHVSAYKRRKPHKRDPEDGIGMPMESKAPQEGPGIVKREDIPGPQREQRKGRRGAEIIGGGDKRSTDKPQEGVTIIKGKS